MRLAVARDQGLDEETIAHAVTPGGSGNLTPAQSAAVRLADAVMTQPGQLDPALVAELHQHFSVAQLTELTLDIMKWNAQKVAVALGADDPIDPDGLTDLVFDADGNWVR